MYLGYRAGKVAKVEAHTPPAAENIRKLSWGDGASIERIRDFIAP